MLELYWVLRVLLVLAFLTSGLPKILRMSRFKAAVEEYNILPRPLIPVFAYIATFLEVGSGFCLAMGWQVEPAAAALCALLSAYGIAIGINLYRHSEIDCHCFDALAKSSLTAATLLRAVMLLIAAGWTALYHPQWLRSGSSLAALNIADVFAYGGLALILWALLEVAQTAFVLARDVRREYQR